MYAAECERRGMKVLYVDNDSTCVQGLSYDLIIIDEFFDVVKEQQDNE
jgi:DNA polymerase elongation subunit (family B)